MSSPIQGLSFRKASNLAMRRGQRCLSGAMGEGEVYICNETIKSDKHMATLEEEEMLWDAFFFLFH